MVNVHQLARHCHQFNNGSIITGSFTGLPVNTIGSSTGSTGLGHSGWANNYYHNNCHCLVNCPSMVCPIGVLSITINGLQSGFVHTNWPSQLSLGLPGLSLVNTTTGSNYCPSLIIGHRLGCHSSSVNWVIGSITIIPGWVSLHWPSSSVRHPLAWVCLPRPGSLGSV